MKIKNIKDVELKIKETCIVLRKNKRLLNKIIKVLIKTILIMDDVQIGEQIFTEMECKLSRYIWMPNLSQIIAVFNHF